MKLTLMQQWDAWWSHLRDDVGHDFTALHWKTMRTMFRGNDPYPFYRTFTPIADAVEADTRLLHLLKSGYSPFDELDPLFIWAMREKYVAQYRDPAHILVAKGKTPLALYYNPDVALFNAAAVRAHYAKV